MTHDDYELLEFETALAWVRDAELFAAGFEDVNAPGLREAIARSDLACARAHLENVLRAWAPVGVQ